MMNQDPRFGCTDLRTVCLDSRAHSPPSQVVWGVGVGVKIAGICTPGQAARKYVHKSTEEHSMAKDERNGNEEQVVSHRAQEYMNLSNRYQIIGSGKLIRSKLFACHMISYVPREWLPFRE